MVKQEIQFVIVTKGSKVTAIGRSQVCTQKRYFGEGINGLMI